MKKFLIIVVLFVIAVEVLKSCTGCIDDLKSFTAEKKKPIVLDSTEIADKKLFDESVLMVDSLDKVYRKYGKTFCQICADLDSINATSDYMTQVIVGKQNYGKDFDRYRKIIGIARGKAYFKKTGINEKQINHDSFEYVFRQGDACKEYSARRSRMDEYYITGEHSYQLMLEAQKY